MPARREISADTWREEAGRLERRREQNRLAQQRHRARHADGHADIAGFNGHAHEGTPARSFPLVTSLPTVKRDNEEDGDFERVHRILAPVRGYVHNEGHLADLAEKFPDVDLVLEARGMARWVNDTRRGNGCTEAFMTNWVKKAAAKAAAVTGSPQEPRPEPRSVLGRVLQQIATDPVAGPRTWH